MRIYKLKFNDKDQSLSVLQEKGVLVAYEEGFIYGDGIQAVVEIGVLYDEQDPPMPIPGYCYDIMCIQDIDFGSFIVVPLNPKHTFAGYLINDELIP